MTICYRWSTGTRVGVALFWVIATAAALCASIGPAPPQLVIRLYDFAGLSRELRTSLLEEAVARLGNLQVRLAAIDCTAPANALTCHGKQQQNLLDVRILKTALPEASRAALGLAATAPNGSAAAVFYDRAEKLSGPDVRLSAVLGAAVAHEVAHLLLPPGSHSGHGLMRAEWSAADLRIGSRASFGLSKKAVNMIRREAQRKTRQDRDSWWNLADSRHPDLPPLERL